MSNEEIVSAIADIESNLLALRKIAEQGLLMAERLKQKAAALQKQPRKTRVKPVKYSSLILSGARATKRFVHSK